MGEPIAKSDDERLLEHAKWVRRLAGTLVRNDAAADDLAQDTWVAALERRPSTRRPLRPWLRTVARNFARRSLRRGGLAESARAQRAESASNELPDPAELTERLETERALTEALSRLEEPFRSTLLLRFYEDLEPSEIARRQNTPAGTVRWRLKRGLELLRSRLDERFGDRASWSALFVSLANPSPALPLAGSPPTSSAVTASSETAATLAGVLSMKLAIQVVAASLLIAAVGITATGSCPEVLDLRGPERPADVDFRPIPRDVQASETIPVAPAIDTAPRRTVGAADAAAPSPRVASPEAVELGPTLVDAVVLDASERPIPDALLRWSDRPQTFAHANPDGSATLELDVEAGGRRVVIEVAAHGYASRAEDVFVEEGQRVNIGTVELAPGGVISGRVVDELDRPVPNATLSLSDDTTDIRSLDRRRYNPVELRAPFCSTDPDGRFRLAGAPVGFIRLRVAADGMRPEFSAPIPVRAGEESFGARIVLQELADENVIRGRVIDPEGRPLPGADLRYSHNSRRAGTGISATMYADEEGAFEFRLPDDAVLSITASDPEDRFASISADGIRTGELDLVLRLTEPRTLRLAVTTPEGAPVERFGFDVQSADGDLSYQRDALDDHPDGVARLRLPASEFTVRVTAPGFQIATTPPLLPDALGSDYVLELVPLPGIEGVVGSTDGPVAGATVELMEAVPDDEEYVNNGFRVWVKSSVLERAKTDEDGRFRVTVRTPGRYVMRAEVSGLAPGDVGPFVVSPTLTAAPLTIELLPPGAVEGRVFGPAGASVAGTIVGASRRDGHARTLRVDESGKFRFDGLMPGDWEISLRDEEVFPTQRTVSVSYGDDIAPLDDASWRNCTVYPDATTYFDLEIAGPEALFEGRLVTTGRAMPWTVRMLGANESFASQDGPSARLDARGRFQLPAGMGDPAQLVFSSGLEQPGEEQLIVPIRSDAPTTSWEYALETAPVTFSGLRRWDDVPEFVLVWKGGNGAFSFVAPQPEEDGTCTFDNVPVGRVTLSSPGREPSNYDPRAWKVLREIEIRSGEQNRVDL